MTSAFEQVKAWRTGLDTEVVGVQDAIVSGWNQEVATDTTVDDVLTATASQSVTVDNTDAVTDSLATEVLLPRIQPLWTSRAPQDDVSSPIFALNPTTSVQTLGAIFLSPIRATLSRTYEAVKTTVTGTTMTSYFVGIYQLDTSTGLATKIQDLGNVKASINGSVQIQSFNLTAPLSVNKGDVFYVATLQVGGTAAQAIRSYNNPPSMLSATPTYPTTTGLRTILTTNTTLPSTIAWSTLTTAVENFFAALGYISSAPPPTYVTLSDTFNRADGSVGGLWVPRYASSAGVLNVVDQMAQASAGAVGYTYGTPLESDDQQVEILIGRDGGFEYAHSGIEGRQFAYGIILRADQNGCVMGRLLSGKDPGSPGLTYTNGWKVQIKTFSNWTLNSNLDGGTTRATIPVGAFPGNNPYSSMPLVRRWRFKAVGNVYEMQHFYPTGWSTELSWTDSGAVYSYAGKTAIGFATCLNDTYQGLVDTWLGRDI